jgi:hypothetical protein
MAVSTSTPAWTLRMPAGSAQQWQFTLTTQTPGGYTPYPIPPLSTWEYVVRATQTDTGTPIFSITTSAGLYGVITVTQTAVLSQVQLGIVATATSALQPGTYYHCLWMNPGTASALAVFDGQLLIEGAPPP